jgi:hypothetical protein
MSLIASRRNIESVLYATRDAQGDQDPFHCDLCNACAKHCMQKRAWILPGRGDCGTSEQRM